MARPSKSVRVKTGAIASDVEAVRQDMEDKLRGENAAPEPPEGLTDGQREIFQFIVDGLVASDILGRLDVFVLESTPACRTHEQNIRAICGGAVMSFACRHRPEPRLAVWLHRSKRRKRIRCCRS